MDTGHCPLLPLATFNQSIFSYLVSFLSIKCNNNLFLSHIPKNCTEKKAERKRFQQLFITHFVTNSALFFFALLNSSKLFNQFHYSQRYKLFSKKIFTIQKFPIQKILNISYLKILNLSHQIYFLLFRIGNSLDIRCSHV